MPQKPLARAPRSSWSQATATRMPQKPLARALRGFEGRLVPNVAFWSHYRKALGKRLECRKSLRPGRREAVEARLLPPECRKAFGKGAAGDLKAGECLTLLSEATRKALGKRLEYRKSLRPGRREAVEARLLPPECRKSLWQGRCGGFEGRLVPNVAFWSH